MQLLNGSWDKNILYFEFELRLVLNYKSYEDRKLRSNSFSRI